MEEEYTLQKWCPWSCVLLLSCAIDWQQFTQVDQSWQASHNQVSIPWPYSFPCICCVSLHSHTSGCRSQIQVYMAIRCWIYEVALWRTCREKQNKYYAPYFVVHRGSKSRNKVSVGEPAEGSLLSNTHLETVGRLGHFLKLLKRQCAWPVSWYYYLLILLCISCGFFSVFCPLGVSRGGHALFHGRV